MTALLASWPSFLAAAAHLMRGLDRQMIVTCPIWLLIEPDVMEAAVYKLTGKLRRAPYSQMLRLFLGEGDQYAGWEHVPMASIHWHRLPPGSVVELPSVAAAQRWLKRGSNQLIRAATLS